MAFDWLKIFFYRRTARVPTQHEIENMDTQALRDLLEANEQREFMSRIRAELSFRRRFAEETAVMICPAEPRHRR